MSLSIACLPARTRPGPFLFHDLGEDLGHGQWLDVVVHVIGSDHEDRPVRAHGESGAERLLRLLHADGDRDHLVGLPGLLQADGFLDGDLVERVHRHLHVRKIDPAPVRLHANLHVVVDHALHGHEHLHGLSHSSRNLSDGA
jgi:hypothetical protein